MYCGDGKNDFCPSTLLNVGDVLYMRNGKGLEKHLGKVGNREKIVCEVSEWVDHDALLQVVLK